jgi:putative ABC transport system ATP-binding protein
MMHKGKIVMDISGDERHKLSAQGLLERYKEAVHEELDTDRILLES